MGIAAGPVGAAAQQDLISDIVSFSRSKGLYGGVDLTGSALTVSDDWNRAYRRSEGLGSLVTFGSPVDTRAAMPFGIPEQVASAAADVLANSAFRRVALPAWASRTGFRLLDPAKSLRSRIEFILQLHDREALLPRERQRRFLEAEGWVAWPGPALAEFLRQFIAHNRMLEGGFVIEDRLVTLADIACPILSFVGTVDEIAPAPGVRAIRQAAPRAEVYEAALPAGHFGLVVGSKSNEISWPTVAAWAHWRDGEGDLPELVKPVVEQEEPLELVPRVSSRLGYGLELAAGIGSGVAQHNRPLVGNTSWMRSFSVVVLPAPFGPRNPNTSPGRTSSVRRSSARYGRLRQKPTP